MERKLLLIENDAREAKLASRIARSYGLDTVMARTFAEATSALGDKPDYVITDLFMPGGDIDASRYIHAIVPHYERALEQYPKIQTGELTKAMECIAGCMGMNKRAFYEAVLAQRALFKNHCRDVAYGRQDHAQYVRVEEFIESAKCNNVDFPYGIFLAEEAKGTPICILTAMGGLSALIKPIEHLLTMPRFHGLVDGHKQWGRALYELTKPEIVRLPQQGI